MPPEIDDHKPRPEPMPLIDFYSFNQSSLNIASDKNNVSDKNISANGGKPAAVTIELSDPYNLHLGLSSLQRVLNGGTAGRVDDSQQQPAKGARGADQTHTFPNPFEFHQGDKNPAKLPGPFLPPGEVRPKPGEQASQPGGNWPKPIGNWPKPGDFAPKPGDQAPKPGDYAPKPPVPIDFTPKPGERPNEFPSPNVPGIGKSPIIDAYERRQGARHAGSGNVLPSIDPIPGPNDRIPPQPGPGPAPRPDVAPWTPPRPDGTKPDVAPWTPPKPDGPKPDIAPWTPPKPDANIKPTDFRPDRPEKPDRQDLINKIEPKYETDNVAKAVQMAKDTGLPLAVHIGASWCGYCVQMERNTWPGVEGTGDKKGSLQGKMVVLHMDVDQAQNLSGQDQRLANEILKNRGSSVPILRVFKVDESGHLTKTNENHGAISSKSGLEAFLIKGGVSR